jgi:type I restriction enzyme, S subunit
MSLPQGWATATIADLIARDGLFVDGDWVESKDQDPDGDVRLVQLADVGVGKFLDKSSRFLTAEKARELRCTFLSKRDVLVARMPEPLGRACLFPGANQSCVTVVDVCVMRTGNNGPDHRWLMWFLNAPDTRVEVAALQSGSTRKRISRLNFATIQIPVPPRPEQDRIVGEIEKQFARLDDAVAALKRVQANLKRYRASVLKAACEGRLVPTEAELARKEGRSYEPACELLKRILAERRAKWEADQLQRMIAVGKQPTNDEWKKKYKEPEIPDITSLPPVPEGWLWVSLDQIADIQGGIQKQPKREPKKNFYPYLRVANVYRGRLELSEIEQMELFGDELDKLRLRKNDLLIVEGNGSPSEIGRMAIWRGEIQDCVHQNHIIRARLASGVMAEFCAAHWNSPQGSSEVMQVASSTSGLYTLSTAKVARFCLPLPPIAEQIRIVEEVQRKLSKIDACEHAMQHQTRHASSLRSAVLKTAFSGNLVPQDPEDEPASVLLDRIRAERAALATNNGNRRATPEAGTANGQRRRRVARLAHRVSGGKGAEK